MHRTILFRRIAIATGVVFGLGAVTAFGVAPLSALDLPPEQRVVDPLELSLRTPESIDRFSQAETVRRGDTLAQLLARAGAGDEAFLRFVASDPLARKALQMQPGRSVQITTDQVGHVLRFTYRLTEPEREADTVKAPRQVVVVRRNGRFVARDEEVVLERSTEMRSVEIRASLFAATDAAGIPEQVAISVANIFGGDVDFSRDLRPGDRLRVVYELLHEKGSLEQPVSGRILAAELLNSGRRHEAFWFERNGRGEYFTFDGRSLRKTFLRNPLEFSRMSSGFSGSRLHPIFQDWRAHKGIDFFAPTGTPVRASADGVVEFIGQQRGFGNMVVVRHPNPHSSLYAHLSAFNPSLRVGQSVRQGDLLGNVGATGWATGPHLHYELKVNGIQVDPMSVAMPEPNPLEGPERLRLVSQVSALRGQFVRLDTLKLSRFE